ncbi:hypothetical protein XENORESO_012857, partial [Xenotaenia resolanae]
VFAECHRLISPSNFYQGCVFDSCHVSNKAVLCNSLEVYAAACADIGVCIHWRNHTNQCVTQCPSNKIYKPCGPAEQPTCEQNSIEPSINYTTEGCFCPEGMKLFSKKSNICVRSCGCLDPDKTPRKFNETFEYKCQNCICDESTETVICKPKMCPVPAEQTCIGPGFVLVNQTDPSDPCCIVHVCQCQSNTCPINSMNCPVGYRLNISVPEEKCCPEYKCESIRVCVSNNVEYQPGSSVPGWECENCTCSTNSSSDGLMEVKCTPQQCKELNCPNGFEYKKTNPDECCGNCEQTHCVINVNGTEMLLK